MYLQDESYLLKAKSNTSQYKKGYLLDGLQRYWIQPLLWPEH